MAGHEYIRIWKCLLKLFILFNYSRLAFFSGIASLLTGGKTTHSRFHKMNEGEDASIEVAVLAMSI